MATNEAVVSVFDVASYILSKLGRISTAKLQKLVYYCQAWSLVWDERPLFGEKIEAWVSGPVVPELYNYHKGQFVISEVPGNPGNLDQDAIDTIDAIIDFYGQKNSQWLSDLVRWEDPWKNARQVAPIVMKNGAVISLESMAEYYSSLWSDDEK